MGSELTTYTLKNSDKRNSKLKYDFMPSLLEIIERPSHIAGTIAMITVVLLIAAAVVWACLSELDVVVNGMGRVVPDGRLIDIHSLASGKVETVSVKDGDYVNAGDVLISLEDRNVIEVAQLEQDMEWCGIMLGIVEELLNNDNYEIHVDNYDEKYVYGLTRFVLEIDMYKWQMMRYYEELEEANTLLEEQREGSAAALELQDYIKTIEDNIHVNNEDYRLQLYNMLYSLNNEKNDCEARLEELRLSSETYLIKSPVDGYVNMITIISTGQTITAGSTVATIVPTESSLIVECYIPDSNRGDIDIGMETKIKLAAYPFSDYGEITGKVQYISPSTFSTEAYGNVYVVNVGIEREDINSEIELTSGLSGNVEILVGKRTVIRYFLDPIMGTVRESMREN